MKATCRMRDTSTFPVDVAASSYVVSPASLSALSVALLIDLSTPLTMNSLPCRKLQNRRLLCGNDVKRTYCSATERRSYRRRIRRESILLIFLCTFVTAVTVVLHIHPVKTNKGDDILTYTRTSFARLSHKSSPQSSTFSHILSFRRREVFCCPTVSIL
jgi:hypothetical protein